MPVTFNPDEVFEMAVEIERRAATFYRKAAENASNARAAELFLNLAEMEKGHEKTFSAMKTELTAADREPAAFDPEGEAAYYLQALAAAHGWEGKMGKFIEFRGSETPEEVYRIAIAAEQQSINFYVGLREYVPSPSAQDRVRGIIREEMSHLVSLTNALNSLGRQR
jgi:rubrerythrin